jgi:hypothetical protein
MDEERGCRESQVWQLKDDREICNKENVGGRGVVSALILDIRSYVAWVLEVTAKETEFPYEEGNV